MDDKTVSSKQKEVLKWLQDMFGDEPVPSFHCNDVFIDHLYELKTHECQLDKQRTTCADFVTSLIQDYKDDLSSTIAILNRVGLTSCIDSVDAETNILASMASTLSLDSLDECSFVLSLTKLLMDKEQTTSQVTLLEKSLEDNSRKLKENIQVNNQLESLLDSLSREESHVQDTMKNQTREISFLQSKTNKYKSDQKSQDRKLVKSGFTETLTHDRLLADHDELQVVTERLEKTKEELHKFAALPADKVLAQVKLEVAKSELRELEDELVKQIDIGSL